MDVGMQKTIFIAFLSSFARSSCAVAFFVISDKKHAWNVISFQLLFACVKRNCNLNNLWEFSRQQFVGCFFACEIEKNLAAPVLYILFKTVLQAVLLHEDMHRRF